MRGYPKVLIDAYLTAMEAVAAPRMADAQVQTMARSRSMTYCRPKDALKRKAEEDEEESASRDEAIDDGRPERALRLPGCGACQSTLAHRTERSVVASPEAASWQWVTARVRCRTERQKIFGGTGDVREKLTEGAALAGKRTEQGTSNRPRRRALGRRVEDGRREAVLRWR